MGLQVVIDAKDLDEAIQALKGAGAVCDIFPIPNDRIGISIPTKAFDSVGDAVMTKALSSFSYVDLWSGDRCGKHSK